MFILGASEILPGLWQGPIPPTGLILSAVEFDTLVLAAEEYQPSSSEFPGVSVIHCPFDDTREPLPVEVWRLIRRCARLVAARVKRGKKVLVTCHAGKNRSGLIVGLALHYMTGMSGRDAIRLITSRRPIALSNEVFRGYLKDIPEK